MRQYIFAYPISQFTWEKWIYHGKEYSNDPVLM